MGFKHKNLKRFLSMECGNWTGQLKGRNVVVM
jgi:hypothetical protein